MSYGADIFAECTKRLQKVLIVMLYHIYHCIVQFLCNLQRPTHLAVFAVSHICASIAGPCTWPIGQEAVGTTCPGGMDGKHLVAGTARRAVTLSGCASARARRRHRAASSQPAMDRARVLRRARRLLGERFDHDEFRAGQLEAIIDIVDAAQPNAGVISVMATGTGKVRELCVSDDRLAWSGRFLGILPWDAMQTLTSLLSVSLKFSLHASL